MKKKLLAVLLTVAMVATMVACGSKEEAPADAPAEEAEGEEEAEAPAEVIELVVGGVTSQSAKDAVILFGEKVEEYSNGTITILDFPDNQLGNDEQRFEMTQTGECDISIGSTSSVANTYGDFFIYDVYYMFLNKEEVYNVGMRGEAAKQILAGLEEIGLKGLPFMENGFRNITTSDVEVNTVEDAKGLKLRTMENAIHLAAWQGLGTNPTPMAFSEVFTALQQGTIDGQENGFTVTNSNNLFEVQKYLTVWNYMYECNLWIANSAKFSSLKPETQEYLLGKIEEACQYGREIVETGEEDLKKEFAEKGMEIHELTVEELAAFQEAVKPVVEEYSALYGEEACAAFRIEN